MKQFLITAAGVFAGLLIFMIGVPFVLVSMLASAAGLQPLVACEEFHDALPLPMRSE